LADLAQHFGVGKNKRIILVVERAGWHSRSQVKVPKGIHLFFLPAYSPELQPAERLWPLTNEPIANRCFESLDELFRCVMRSLSPFTSTTRLDPWFNFLSLVALLCHP
jgi:transposase